MQTANPAASLKKWSGQSMHVLCADIAWTVPGLHGAQKAVPGLGATEPGLQISHVAIPRAPA